VKYILIILFFFSFFVSCNKKNSSNANQVTLIQDEKQIVAFIYHRFGDSEYPSTNTSLEDFESHLKYLQEQKLPVLTLSHALESLNKRGGPKRIIVLTIDDGFLSFYENGLPLLKEYQFPATLFINTETVGGNTYMDWAQIREVKEAGIEIGNHTHSHSYFLNIPDDERYIVFQDEIRQSQKLIEENLGITPDVFAYPYGEYDAKMKDIVEKEGFAAAVAQNSGVIGGQYELFALPRFPMSSSYASISDFSEKVNMNSLSAKEVGETLHLIDKGHDSPELKFEISTKNLQFDQMQCFIQGGECVMKKDTTSRNSLVVSIKAEAPLIRRRTLYTITVPDQDGNWYWYSHLWINPSVSE